MVLTLKNYNTSDATIGDVLTVWQDGQLPKNVFKVFNSIITDVTIRSLHQSDYKMFKNSLVVDNFIEVENLMLVVSKEFNVWQLVLYKRDKDGMLIHQDTSFVKNDNKLKNAISDSLWGK